MESKFKIEFEITLDRMSASGVAEMFRELFPTWKNLNVIQEESWNETENKKKAWEDN